MIAPRSYVDIAVPGVINGSMWTRLIRMVESAFPLIIRWKELWLARGIREVRVVVRIIRVIGEREDSLPLSSHQSLPM